MKTLRQIIFAFVAIVGLSLAVSAQKNDQKKPPKEPPPVINPGKKPPKERPKNNSPKKPGNSYYIVQEKSDNLS